MPAWITSLLRDDVSEPISSCCSSTMTCRPRIASDAGDRQADRAGPYNDGLDIGFHAVLRLQTLCGLLTHFRAGSTRRALRGGLSKPWPPAGVKRRPGLPIRGNCRKSWRQPAFVSQKFTFGLER